MTVDGDLGTGVGGSDLVKAGLGREVHEVGLGTGPRRPVEPSRPDGSSRPHK